MNFASKVQAWSYFIKNSFQSLTKTSQRPTNDSGDEDNVEGGDEDDDGDDESPDIDMNWNLATFLQESGACQKNFYTVVVGK